MPLPPIGGTAGTNSHLTKTPKVQPRLGLSKLAFSCPAFNIDGRNVGTKIFMTVSYLTCPCEVCG